MFIADFRAVWFNMPWMMLSKTRWLRPRRLARFSPPRGDPSRTTTIVNAYQRDLDRRWAELNKALRVMIVDNDVLGLSDTPPRVLLQIQPAGRFTFPTDPAGSARAFSRWLRGAMDRGVLEIVGGSPTGWQNKYVRASYSRGVEHAEKAMRAVGLVPEAGALAQTLNQPIHVEKLQLLFGRNFSELQGITDVTSQRLRRIVTEGLATGQSPRTVSRNISRTLRNFSRNRSLMLARTETIRSHATATLTSYRQSGVTAVLGFAEFLTAGDDRVCQTCQDLEGRRFTLDSAASIIPVHPNCRCVWLPIANAKAPTTTPIPTRASPFEGFTTALAAKRQMNNRYAGLGLERRQRDAINSYQDGGYSRMNQVLRKPVRPDGTLAPLSGIDRQDMADIDSALRTVPTIGKDTQVWRGGGSGRQFTDLQVGDVLVDKGYVSTSTDAAIAVDFTNSRDNVYTIFKVGLPKDTRGLWMEKAIRDDIEDEFMLAAGSRFKVLKVRQLDAQDWEAEFSIRTTRRFGGQFQEGQVVREISVMLEP